MGAPIAGVIVAIVVGYYQLRPEATILFVEITSLEELTLSPNITGLVGIYAYQGIQVDHLWRERIRISNAGSATLIGRGPASNVLDGRVLLELPSEARIFDLQVDSNEPNATLAQPEPNQLEVRFGQWRSNEILAVTLVVSMLSDDQPIFAAADRQIVDGEIQIQRRLEAPQGTRISYLSRLVPEEIQLIARVIVLAAMGLVVLPMTFFSLWAMFDYWRWAASKKRWPFVKRELLNQIESDKALDTKMKELLTRSVDDFLSSSQESFKLVPRQSKKKQDEVWTYLSAIDISAMRRDPPWITEGLWSTITFVIISIVLGALAVATGLDLMPV